MEQPRELNRVLVIAAHPDDPEFGCGGTVALWAGQGKEVTYVLCTHGQKGSGDPTMTTERLVGIREAEQRAAAAVLGVKDVTFLDHVDGEIFDSVAFRGDIVRVLRQYRPDIVIAQDPTAFIGPRGFLNHPDHKTAGAVVCSAVYPLSRDHLAYPEHAAAGLAPHKVAEMYLFGTCEADTWVDISSTIDTKIAALKKHDSQVGQWPQMEEMIRGWTHENGKDHGCEYAESFRRIVFFR